MILTEKDLRAAVRKALLKEMDQAAIKRHHYLQGLYGGRQGRSPDEEYGDFDEFDPGLVSIEGGIFTLKVGDQLLTFQSVPYQRAAANAVKMHGIIGGASDKGSEEDKDLIFSTVYKKANETIGKPDEKMSTYRKNLGTPSESFWSSWFFTAAYNDDPDYGPKSYPGYPASSAHRKRKKVLDDPKRYEGKTFYMTFKRDEAPIFRGDAIFHWRGISSSNSFNQISNPPDNPLYGQEFKVDGTKNKGESKSRKKLSPAHMKIYAGGNTFIGGNEKGTVRKTSMKIGSNGIFGAGQTAGDGGEYFAVYKKVKLLSPEEAMNADPNIATIFYPENIDNLTSGDGENYAMSAVSEDGIVYLGIENIEGEDYSTYEIPPSGSSLTARSIAVLGDGPTIAVYDLNELRNDEPPYINISDENLGVNIKAFQDFVTLTYNTDIDDEQLFDQTTRTV